jgi:tetratricopeptide (TPR) repeat protein
MNPESNDDRLLEGNVAALLKAADAPPRISADARARVLETLLSAQRARAAITDVRPPTTSGAKRSTPVGSGVWKSLPRSRGGRAALAASAAGFALLVGYLVTRPPTSGGEMSYENAGPGPRVVALRDGSNVTLDVGAAIIERAPRDIAMLRGQAVFEVVAGNSGAASFDVQTVAGRAIASGSRFLVKASTTTAEIAVARGVVQVTGERGAMAEVHAGEESVLSGDAPPKATLAPRVSHLFGFTRKNEADALPGAPESRGTLVGRDPRWQKEASLDLRDFAIDVQVEGGFARTTIDQTFFNPKPRQLEGIYSFPMPKGAAISRLAMYVDGTLMESAIVDRSRGRDIYEGIVEQRRDPALLEWMTGNTFRMRIFPIPARTEKRIFMSYTQPLEHLYGAERLVVPIPPIDQTARHAKFSVNVVDGARYEISSPSHAVEISAKGADRLVTVEQRDVRLGQDLVIRMREKSRDAAEAGADQARVFDEGDRRYLLARSSPDLRALSPRAKARTGRRIAVLFDVSASRSEQALAAQARFVDGLIDAFDETDEVTFLTIGHEARVMPGGLVRARKVQREVVASFLSTQAEGLGDTRLDLGLAAASGALGADEEGDGDPERQVIYVGDGVFVGQGVTPSKTSQSEQLVSALGGRARFIGVGIGDSIDRATLDAVANATRGLSIEVGESEDLSHRAFDLVATTYTPCLGGLSAELLDAAGQPVAGASVALRSTRVCDGERVEVVTRASREVPAAKVRVRGRIDASSPTRDGEPWETSIDVSSAEGGAAFLPRVFAERRVSALLADEPPNAGQAESPNAKEIVSLARQYFLVTPFTSLLVLENDAMYKEFGVEKKKAEGWALYDAPPTVPVVHEPIGSGVIADTGAWDLLERSPTQLFHERQSPLEDRLNLGLIGNIGRARGPSLSGDISGFGSGQGRLGGSHREAFRSVVAPTARPAAKATTDSLRQEMGFGEAARRIDRSVAVDARIQTMSTLSSAVDEQTRSPLAGGVPQVVDGRDWIEQAFQGGSLAAFQYEADPRLSDLTEFVPGMFALPVDAQGDLLQAVAGDAASRDPAALEILEKAQGRLGGSFESETGRQLTLLPDGGVMQTNALALGSNEIVTADKHGLSHAYPELGLRTKRSLGPELVWWLAQAAPLVAPPAAWTEGLRVDMPATRTVRIRAPEGAAETSATLPDLAFTFDSDMRVVKLVRIAGGQRETVTITSDKDDALVFSEGETRRFRSIAAPSHVDVPLVDVMLPLANPKRWQDRLAEPGLVGGGSFARRQLLASYAAMGDTQGLARELDALAVGSGKLSRGEVVLASRAMTTSSDAAKLLSRLPPNDPVRRYLEAVIASGPARESALKQIADESKGSLVGALAAYRNALAAVQRGAANDDIAKGLKLLIERYPAARFFHFAIARQANDRIGYRDTKLVVGLWDLLAADEVLRPVADRHVAVLERNHGGDAEQAARRALRAIDAGFERGYSFDIDWTLRSAVTSARGDAGLELVFAKWRGKIRKSGSAAQVLGFVRATSDPYGRAPQDAHVGGVLRRLNEVDVDEDTRLRIAAMLVAQSRLPEAKLVLQPLITDEARPEVLELGAVLAERTGDLETATTLLDRLLRETAGQPVEMTAVRGWYTKLIDLSLRKARTEPELTAATNAVLAIASRWRREDGGNAAIDEVCAAALFRVGRDKEGRLYLSSIVERRPAEGAAWGRAGELLQAQGEIDAALASYSRAAMVEPTNPTWDLRHAQGLLSRGEATDEATARTLLARIADRQASAAYQSRFSNIVSDASRLSESLKLSP